MTRNANEATNSRSFPEKSVFASSIHSSMILREVLIFLALLQTLLLKNLKSWWNNKSWTFLVMLTFCPVSCCQVTYFLCAITAYRKYFLDYFLGVKKQLQIAGKLMGLLSLSNLEICIKKVTVMSNSSI